MASPGWYCIEATNDQIANDLFLEYHIDVNKISDAIYWLNKQPITAGQRLLLSDWTRISIENVKYRKLKAGIYWYEVVKDSSTDYRCYVPKIEDIIFDLNYDISLNTDISLSLENPEFIAASLLWQDSWIYDISFVPFPKINPKFAGVLHNSKAYIGWKESNGDFVYDYSKEYTLTYSTNTAFKGHMHIEAGDTFGNHMRKFYNDFGAVGPTELKVSFSFTHFEKRKAIEIYLSGVKYYLFNHADPNMNTTFEIGCIQSLFAEQEMEAVNDDDAKIIFNSIIEKYWDKSTKTFYPSLGNKFATDVSNNDTIMYILNSGQKMIGHERTDGDIKNHEYANVVKVQPTPFYGWDNVNEKTHNRSYYYIAKGSLIQSHGLDLVAF